MNLYDNKMYMDDVKYVASLSLNWKKLFGKCIVVSGATGLIGSFFIDVIMEKIKDCKIYALARNEDKFKVRFKTHLKDERLEFVEHDINLPLKKIDRNIDYVLHLASNTHPLQYATDPIGTITTNIIGVQNLLDFSVEHGAQRFLFASSNEIYGENRGDVELFDENYCGYIDCNTLRAGYPESKRCAEALCQAYKKQNKIDVVVARFTRSYGPTMLLNDTKAISQFIKKAISGENIILKSDGQQYYSYQYVADSVSGLLTVLLNGENGEAYNIAAENSDIKLKDLANILANISGTSVVYEIPDVIESTGYSKATKARLSGEKIRNIGWSPRYDIRNGVERTVGILRSLESKNIED